jgi:hypothetical protein
VPCEVRRWGGRTEEEEEAERRSEGRRRHASQSSIGSNTALMGPCSPVLALLARAPPRPAEVTGDRHREQEAGRESTA